MDSQYNGAYCNMNKTGDVYPDDENRPYSYESWDYDNQLYFHKDQTYTGKNDYEKNFNPYEGTAYTNMGTIYLLRCEYENAKQCYDKGLPLIDKCEFDYWLAQANYAVAIAKLGDPERAERMISEAEARGYSNGDVIRKMAGIKKKTFFSRLFG